MQKLEKIYEGKAKVLYKTTDEGKIIQYFKDDATAFNNQKKDVIAGKGILNNYISEFIMLKLTQAGIPNHFIQRLDDRMQLVSKVQIIPLEVIVRNISAGSMAKRLGIDEGIELSSAVFEICYKRDDLGDPIINDDHATLVLKLASKQQLETIKAYSLKINAILQELFANINITLVDFKIEFGLDSNQNIILADEISPDSCRLWDMSSLEKLDKDRFRRNIGGLVEAYLEVANRLKIQNLPNLN